MVGRSGRLVLVCIQRVGTHGQLSGRDRTLRRERDRVREFGLRQLGQAGPFIVDLQRRR